jgi:hypothetical protein
MSFTYVRIAAAVAAEHRSSKSLSTVVDATLAVPVSRCIELIASAIDYHE